MKEMSFLSRKKKINKKKDPQFLVILDTPAFSSHPSGCLDTLPTQNSTQMSGCLLNERKKQNVR